MAQGVRQDVDQREWSSSDLVGTSIEVRNQFDGSWGGGFQIAGVVRGSQREPRIRVRRISDGQVLPEEFSAADVIRATSERQ